jgi:hypothetical protein
MYYRSMPYYDPEEVAALLLVAKGKRAWPRRGWWRIVARAVLANPSLGRGF